MMRNRVYRSTAAVFLVLMLTISLPSSVFGDETSPPGAPVVTHQQVMDSIIKGLEWYADNQNVDGSWSASVGVTGFVVICFAGAGYDHTNRTVQKALGHLRNFYRPDSGMLADTFPNYETSLGLMAMAAAGDPVDEDKLPKMAAYLENTQFYEGGELNMTEDWYLGGWPNYAGIPDVSNSQFALLGLQTAQLLLGDYLVPGNVWENATTFMNICQNWPDVNALPWAHNITLPSHGDGGFVYNGYRSRTPLGEDMFESYGSITAAGLYSYLVAGNDEGQPEVAEARRWLDHEYNLDVNPRMVGKGLYYYLWTQTRALAMSGQDWVVDGAGNLHDWRAEVADLFMDLQLPNGGWPGNPQIGWREEEPEIAGIYAILSMQAAYLAVPNPRLSVTVSDVDSVRFIDLEGNVLTSDPVRGLEVTEDGLSCTHPETFRKVWVEVTGAREGSSAIIARGTWGEDREAVDDRMLAPGTSTVLVATGGFAGPFGIYLKDLGSSSPALRVDKRSLELVRGETEVIDFEVTETTGNAPITRAMLITYGGEGIVADVDVQGIDVPAGDVDVIRLTVSVAEDFPASDEVYLVISSSTAPPKVIKVDVVDSEGSSVAIGLWYWLVVILLVVLVFFFLLLPKVAKGGEEAEEPEVADGVVEGADEADGPGPLREPEPEDRD